MGGALVGILAVGKACRWYGVCVGWSLFYPPEENVMARQAQSDNTSSGRSAIELLTADHEKVNNIFEQFKRIKDKGSDEDKHALVKQACNELTVHAMIEEEIFYPAVRGTPDTDDLLDEAKVEHASIKKLVTDLEFMNPGDDLYDAKFTVLGEYVKHHVEEEQNQIFPRAKKSGVDMDQLAEDLVDRKQELAGLYGIEVEEQEQEQEMPVASSQKRSRSASSSPKNAP
jgi:hemerythrin superfamily protein